MIAHRIIRGVEKDVPAEELVIEQLVLVKQQETFPADGIIVEGNTTVDESALRGDEEPLEKLPSSKVYAGTTNISGRVVVRVTASGNNTFQTKLQAYIAKAAASESVLEHRSRNVAAIVPLVALFVAIATVVVAWPVSPTAAICSGFSVLIVSAPWLFKSKHAYTSYLSMLAKRGVLVENASMLEKLGTVDTIIFDKTGIVTTGNCTLEHVVSFKPYTQQQVLNTAAAIEAHSKHAAGLTIVAFARSHGAALQRIEQRQEHEGGVSAKLNSKTILVGSADFFAHHHITLPAETSAHAAEGKTIVYVAADKELLGYILLREEMRPDAHSIMQKLKQHAIVVLAGNEESEATVATTAGFDAVTSGSSKKHGVVAHVVTQESRATGDITITLGSRSLSNISILRSDLASVDHLFETGRVARRHVVQRFIIGSLYHVIALPTAALAYLVIGPLVVIAAAAALIVTLIIALLESRPGIN